MRAAAAAVATAARRTMREPQGAVRVKIFEQNRILSKRTGGTVTADQIVRQALWPSIRQLTSPHTSANFTSLHRTATWLIESTIGGMGKWGELAASDVGDDF